MIKRLMKNKIFQNVLCLVGWICFGFAIYQSYEIGIKGGLIFIFSHLSIACSNLYSKIS
jgi:hypothetical protein